MADAVLTVANLRTAAAAAAAAAEAARDELNTQDGKLGDGDLGITVAGGFAAIAEDAPGFADDLGQAFLGCAKAFQRVSSSSFGTLVATAFMSAAKATKGRTEAAWSELPGIIAGARDAMLARGRGEIGAKSVLDSLDAIAKATEGLTDPDAILAAADRAAVAALEEFRDKPNKLGRARMFAEKSRGLDDPGMLAVRRVLAGLTG
jgi:phosphoenolpyruvate---glycerone phosphotransferase subunit DhaL